MASITSYAAVGISFFQNKTLLEYQTKNFNDEFIILRLEETVDTVNNVPIQIYSSSTIDDFDHSIKSSLAFGSENVTFVIDQNDILYRNVEIALLENSTVLEYQATKFDDEFLPVNLFGLAQVNSIIYANTITATTAFGTTQFIYNQNILLGDTIEALSIYPIQNYASTTISEVIASLDYSITSSIAFGVNNLFVQIHPDSTESTLAFGSSQLNSIIYAQSVESTLAFGSENLNFRVAVNSVNSSLTIGDFSIIPLVRPESVTIENSFGTPKLNSILYANSYESSIAFGTPQINMEIEDVPFPSITSTVVISNPSIKFSIKPLSIATTVNFGTASFIDNIHRLLVFKDDNISKIGDNDAVVIAGGIRINPSSAVSETAVSGNAILPNNPVGFISVNIGGTDYLMPYYNA